MSALVIVESPTKARTIRNYLPSGYRVEASMGHVRDLPQSADEIPAKYKKEAWAKQLGVNVDSKFEPLYVVPKDKKKVVKQLTEALKNAEELILATDEDREGESISWHLQQVLSPKVPIKRMVFHEITREAIQKALGNCREIDQNLVHAQETRRILDRLVGFTLSPLLWRKIAPGLSAGRVQSVAVRLLVQRERERRAFRTGSYWDLKAALAVLEDGKALPFDAKLVSLGGKKLATGSDFDETTGKIAKGRDVVLLSEEEAVALRDRLQDKTWQVQSIDERSLVRRPSPPFTTSTLQQEANRKLRMGARETMRTAQSLYENGYITYMRTDSVHLSSEAIGAARQCVETKYGKEYLSPKPRQYTTKTKGAQEAHEAIRPAGNTFRTPQETGLSGRDLQLYDLIWKRTVACQMADSQQTQITVATAVEEAIFQTTGKRIDFAGFLRAYVEGSDDPEAALEDRETILPPLKAGDRPNCQELEAVGHETKPPARFTEASLVKTLESEGIGRPSTYATVIGTIVDRGYANPHNNALVPSFTAFAVTELLEQHFPDLVNTGFTANMEQTLDEIATGAAAWLPYLQKFYLGETGLKTQTKERESQIDPVASRTVDLGDLEGARIRIGKFGPYVETEGEDGRVSASLPRDLTPADVTQEQIELLLRQKTAEPESLGTHPETSENIYVLIGRYGPYVQLGEVTEENKRPKRTSLPKGMQPGDVTLDKAVSLLSLPRTLGEHPETGKKIKAAIGPFGPYVVHDRGKDGKDYCSLKASDDVLVIELPRALELLEEKAKRGGGRKRGGKKPLRELGVHPDDEKPINIYEGPYGIYVKYGRTNAGLPEGETPETMTLEKALELLEQKSKSKGKKKGTKTAKSTSKATAKTAAEDAEGDTESDTEAASKTTKTATKKTATKKTATKKTAAKTTTKKTTAKKTTTKKTAAKKTATKESSSS